MDYIYIIIGIPVAAIILLLLLTKLLPTKEGEETDEEIEE